MIGIWPAAQRVAIERQQQIREEEEEGGAKQHAADSGICAPNHDLVELIALLMLLRLTGGGTWQKQSYHSTEKWYCLLPHGWILGLGWRSWGILFYLGFLNV